jgi:hypothetical protein
LGLARELPMYASVHDMKLIEPIAGSKLQRMAVEVSQGDFMKSSKR